RSSAVSSTCTTASTTTITARRTCPRRSRSADMWFVLALALAAGGPAERLTVPPEVIADIQVHGNLVTTDEELKRMTAVSIGEPFQPSMVDEIADRLRATKRFERVQVLKRFASIADPSQIVLVVIVDEGRVTIAKTNDPDHPYQAVRSHWPKLMYAPIFDISDRYGVTYGVRVAVPNVLGADSRVSVPFAWGGEKRAGLDFDKSRGGRFFDRVSGGLDWSRRTHPVYDEAVERVGVTLRAEHWIRPQLRLGLTGGVEHDTFGLTHEDFGRAGVDVIVDTRVDPALPRNAVYGRAAWTAIAGAGESELDGRAYLGVVGQLILGVRAQRTAADPSLPVYLKPIF